MPNFKPYLTLALFMLCATLLPAQRVALVFSGGGAKGLVHLGVIKALEENEIPIDAIAGPSIGDIVGGMYAAGYTVDEIVAYLASDDFKKWSKGEYNSEGNYYYKRLDPTAEMFTVRLNINKRLRTKLVLPTNYIPPYQMDLAFLQLFAGAKAVSKNKLDSLFIPFRAVSYDAYNKRTYVPDSGDVGALIRASMSFPGIFKPVAIDGMLLFDGGMINNFPVTVAQKEFSPDFIVGVKCTDNYARPTEDDVWSHLTSLLSRPTEYNIPEGKGVLVDIDSLNVGLMEFSQVKKLVELGYNATMKQMPYIKSHVQRRVNQDKVRQNRLAFREKMPKYRFKNVSVDGVNVQEQNYISDEIQGKPNTTFSFTDLKKRFFDVVADEGVSTFFPTANYNPLDSTYSVNLQATAAPNFRLSLGGCFSNFSNLGFFGAEYQYYARLSVRAAADVYFGNVYNSQKILGRVDYHFKKLRLPVFAELAATHNSFDYYSNNPDMIFSDTRPDFMQDDEVFETLNLGTRFFLNSTFKVGGTIGMRSSRYYTTPDFKSKDVPELMNFNFATGHASIERNSFNYKMFPTSGTMEKVAASYITGKEFHTYGTTAAAVSVDSTLIGKKIQEGGHDFWSIKYVRQQYLFPTEHFSLGYHAELVMTQRTLFSDYYSTLLMLPAFEPMPNTPGFFLENFRAPSYLAVGVIPNFIFTNRLYLRTEIYAFRPFSKLSKENSIEPVKYEKGGARIFNVMGAASLIFNTPIGPLTAAVSYYDKPNQNFYFSISFGFCLYNKRALY